MRIRNDIAHNKIESFFRDADAQNSVVRESDDCGQGVFLELGYEVVGDIKEPVAYMIDTYNVERGKSKKVYTSQRFMKVDGAIRSEPCVTMQPVDDQLGTATDDWIHALQKQGSWYRKGAFFLEKPSMHVEYTGVSLENILEDNDMQHSGLQALFADQNHFVNAFMRVVDTMKTSGCHMDIKLANILLNDQGALTLIDWPTATPNHKRNHEFNTDYTQDESAVGGYDKPLLVGSFQDVFAITYVMTTLLQRLGKTDWPIFSDLMTIRNDIKNKIETVLANYSSSLAGYGDYDPNQHMGARDEDPAVVERNAIMITQCFWAEPSERVSDRDALVAKDCNWLGRWCSQWLALADKNHATQVSVKSTDGEDSSHHSDTNKENNSYSLLANQYGLWM